MTIIMKYDSIDNSNSNNDNYNKKTIITAAIYKKNIFLGVLMIVVIRLNKMII